MHDGLSYINLFLTYNVNSFQKIFDSETGLPDFHKLIGTMIKSHIPEQKPKIINDVHREKLSFTHFSTRSY